MRTIEQKLTAVNNAEYKDNSTNKYVEEYKKVTLEILENPNTTFSEFIEEQALATDISRLGWLTPWAMLKEQLKALDLYKKASSKEKMQAVNNSITWAPNLEPKILGWVA